MGGINGLPGQLNGKESTCDAEDSGDTTDSTSGWKDPLEEGMATHSSILALENPMNRGGYQATVHTAARSQI